MHMPASRSTTEGAGNAAAEGLEREAAGVHAPLLLVCLSDCCIMQVLFQAEQQQHAWPVHGAGYATKKLQCTCAATL